MLLVAGVALIQGTGFFDCEITSCSASTEYEFYKNAYDLKKLVIMRGRISRGTHVRLAGARSVIGLPIELYVEIRSPDICIDTTERQTQQLPRSKEWKPNPIVTTAIGYFNHSPAVSDAELDISADEALAAELFIEPELMADLWAVVRGAGHPLTYARLYVFGDAFVQVDGLGQIAYDWTYDADLNRFRSGFVCGFRYSTSWLADAPPKNTKPRPFGLKI